MASTTQTTPSSPTGNAHFTVPQGAFFVNVGNRQWLLNLEAGENTRQNRIGGMIFGILLGLIFLFSGIAGLVTGTQTTNADARIFNEGEVAQGEITDLRFHTESDGTENRWVNYRYFVGEIAYTREVEVDAATFDTLEGGGALEVYYLPDKAADSRIKGELNNQPAIIVGAIFTVAGLIIGLTIPYLSRRRAHLFKHGTLVTGRILNTKTKMEEGKERSVIMRYEFKNPNTGERIESGATITRDRRREILPSMGMPVVVMFLNENRYELL